MLFLDLHHLLLHKNLLLCIYLFHVQKYQILLFLLHDRILIGAIRVAGDDVESDSGDADTGEKQCAGEDRDEFLVEFTCHQFELSVGGFSISDQSGRHLINCGSSSFESSSTEFLYSMR